MGLHLTAQYVMQKKHWSSEDWTVLQPIELNAARDTGKHKSKEISNAVIRTWRAKVGD